MKSNLSQDLEKRKKQIQHLEQELTTLRQAKTVAQSAWDDQRKQIAKDRETEIDATKQAVETERVRHASELQEIRDAIRTTKQEHALLLTDTKAIIDTLNTEIGELRHQNKVLTQRMIDLRSEVGGLESEKTVLTDDVARLTEEKTALVTNITELGTTQALRTEEVTTLEEAIQQKQAELEAVTIQHADTVEQSNHELKVLEAKKQDLQLEIAENKQSQDKVRDNLAVWEKKLQEQDQNLRIREEKVAQQQGAIARNYNLLNL